MSAEPITLSERDIRRIYMSQEGGRLSKYIRSMFRSNGYFTEVKEFTSNHQGRETYLVKFSELGYCE